MPPKNLGGEDVKMMKHLTAGLVILIFGSAAYGQDKIAQPPALPSAEEIRQADAKSEEEWFYSVGIQNYVFTLPLTMLERERKVRLNSDGAGESQEVRASRADQ